jgi:PAS domain S-box-containing protein
MVLHPGQSERHVPEERSVEVDPIRRALQENEDWYRDLVDHSRDLLCIHDLEGRLLSVNPAPARVLGYSVEELLQIPLREIIAPEFRTEFDAYLSQIERSGEASGFMAVVTRTGERRIWEYHNTLRSEGVASPIVRGMAHDVTERKRAEAALRASEGRFRSLVRASSQIVWTSPASGQQSGPGGPEWQTFTGQPAAETGEGWAGAIHPEDQERTLEAWDQAVASGSVFAIEHRVRHHDGTYRFMQARAVPVPNASGKIIEWVGMHTDITEKKQVEQELRQAKERLVEEKLYLEQAIDTELGFGEIVGQSKALKAVMEQVGKVASSDATVLLLGETGSGKELVARAIHRLSTRQNSSFIKMNCAAIPSGLLESELFGYEKGAFTGSVSRKIGRLELADKGTLFLDEIGEIPLLLQPKLLRVLQDQEFERLGGTQTLKVNFRLIAATNRDLSESMREKQFRSDLFYRLNVFPITVPPLRERRDDIPLLVEHFVQRIGGRMNRSITSIPKKTMEALMQWDWPGNVRELENFVEHSVILTQGSVLAAPINELMIVPEAGAPGTLRAAEHEHILRILRESNGQLSGPNGAAARLGLPRSTLQSKLKQLGIEHQHYRG